MFAIGWNSFKSSLIFISVILFFSASNANAEDITVFDVRNTLALSDQEPTFKDYYLNAGSVRGLRKGMIITVIRKVSLYDSYQNKSAGEMQLEVGKIKIIHVQKDLAVARDYSSTSRVSSPILDYDFVMLGDALDLESMTTEGKNKSAGIDAESAPDTAPAAVLPAPAPAVNPATPTKASEPQALNAQPEFSKDLASKAAVVPATEGVPAPVTTLQ